MKKLLVFAMAALAFVACNKKEDQQPSDQTLTLTPTSMTLKVGETGTITANVAVTTWASSNESVATVANGVVTAVAEGNAVISATANNVTKTCVVLVQSAGGGQEQQQGSTIEAKRIWPIILDGITYEANSAKIAGDLRVDDVDNHLYVWADGETYNAGEGTGKNYFGNTEGYTALTVVGGSLTWSGLGFCLEKTESVTAANELVAAIKANPDKFFLHIGMKSTDNGSHQMYIFNDAAGRSFLIGSTAIDADKNPYRAGDFARDGDWHGIDVPMSQFVAAISSYTFVAGHNILCVLSGGGINAGNQLNLDAVYFYEKE